MIQVDVQHRLGSFELKAQFVSEGRVTALFGRSGSGKTSLVNIIGGLIRPDHAHISLDGDVIDDTKHKIFVPKHRRRIGYVFQEGRLFPHLTVRQNLLYGWWFTPAAKRLGQLAQIVALLGIGHLLDRNGEHLFSGGDDLFSWVSARTGCGFGVFPELRITHLIAGARLNRAYFLRLVHDHAYSHSILDYLYFGEEHISPGVEGMVRMLLHGVRRGWFSMRCQRAAARGVRDARRFLARRGLHPIRSTGQQTLAHDRHA